MKLVEDEVRILLEQKEYVDTVVLFFAQVNMRGDFKKSASDYEYLSYVAQEIESAYKGRIFQLPIIPYSGEEVPLSLITHWIGEVKSLGFAHVIVVSTDYDCMMTCQKELEESIHKFWITPLPREGNGLYNRTFIASQVNAIMEQVKKKW